MTRAKNHLALELEPFNREGFINSSESKKSQSHVFGNQELSVLVLLGDAQLPDTVKRNGIFNPEDFETIAKLQNGLEKIAKNHPFNFSYFSDHRYLINYLQEAPPALVFNLCDEGYSNDPKKELHIPALLEILNISYTGANPACLGLCYNKSIVRAVAMSFGIPVPTEVYYDAYQPVTDISSLYPALLKPTFGDSSVGITQRSVVTNFQEMKVYAKELHDLLPGTPILAQEYLTGIEYTIGLIGNVGNFTVLPTLAVDYSQLPQELPKILGYESKWLPDSPYWKGISYYQPKIDPALEQQLIKNSMLLFERLECRDYARFDFRADTQGTVKLLEVNPNPGWCWDGKLNMMAGFSGKDYSDLLLMILQAAVEREARANLKNLVCMG